MALYLCSAWKLSALCSAWELSAVQGEKHEHTQQFGSRVIHMSKMVTALLLEPYNIH